MSSKVAFGLVILAIAGCIFYVFRLPPAGALVKIERPLPSIGDCFHMRLHEYQPYFELLDGVPQSATGAQGWMKPDQLQCANKLAYSEFVGLCTPEYLSETQLTQSRYEQSIDIAKSNRKKMNAPVDEKILHFVTVEVNGTQFCAVYSDLEGSKTYSFFRKHEGNWQYDVPYYAANPFSVLPYNNLGAIKEMIASGKARVDEAGKLKPSEK